MIRDKRAIIKIRGLGKGYESANGLIQALQNISFDVAKGEFLSIIGPSGCGKSTLIRLVGDLLHPSAGSIQVDGLTAAEARRKRMFSYVFQNPVLLPWRTVIDNVRLPLEIVEASLPQRATREPRELLQMVGLSEFAERYPNELSGGMQHRVALARALTFAPQILFMDEPFAAIDELTRNALNHELLRVWEEVGVTILYITHSLTEAIFLSNRVLVLTGRPARVKDILEVSFPYPRAESLKESVPFLEMIKWLREKLEPAN